VTTDSAELKKPVLNGLPVYTP
jgi:hypothetical protein